MSDPILTRFEQLEAEVERLRADLNVRSRTIGALLQRADRAEVTLKAVRDAAFRAGYHCRWHKMSGVYNFDPLMAPGDPEGAYAAWLGLLDAAPDVPRGTPPANNCADG